MIAEYKQLKSLYQSRKQEEEAAQSAYTAAYREFLDQQAGILAEALTEGTPCPVCGAVHHPAPARRSADAPTQAELEAKQRHWDKTRKALEQASGNCQLLRARLEEREGRPPPAVRPAVVFRGSAAGSAAYRPPSMVWRRKRRR